MHKSAIIIYHGQYDKLLPYVSETLDRFNFSYSKVERESIDEEDFRDKSIVIVIGGDGTFLRTSHLNLEVPMVGINPDPMKKEGFFMQLDSRNFKDSLKYILQGKYEIIELARLRASINSNTLKELALNDIYVGDAKPYNIFNYVLSVGEKREFQRSSGLIIATGSGSSAWAGSAGGFKMKLDSEEYQFIARELYRGRLTPEYVMEKAMLTKKEILTIEPKSKGILVIDSISREYPLKAGDKVEIKADAPCLKYIVVQEKNK